MASNFLIRTRNHQLLNFGDGTHEKKWKEPFYFVQGADPQFGMIEAYLEKKVDYGWEREIELSRKAVAAINAMRPRPKFFVVCGDLVHAWPGEVKRPAQEADFRDVYSEVHPDIPLLCVCGNHDVGNTPTPESIQDYRTAYGDDYYSFFCGGVFFLVLNSQYYFDRSKVPELGAEQDDWLDQQLPLIKESACKHAVIFQHIPWFLDNADEPDDEMFSIVKSIRLRMLDKFVSAGVTAVFCGHYHRNAGGFYGELQEVVTSAIGACLGDDDHGVRIVKVFDDALKHEYISLDQLPTTIEL